MKKHRLQIEYVPVEKLRLWEKNPRKNDVAAEKLLQLFEAHGFLVPIIATRDGIIRAGNTRYKAAKLKGLKEVPVIYVDFSSEAEAEMFSLADNKASEWAQWDKDMLVELFGQLEERKDARVSITLSSGFTQTEIHELEEPRKIKIGEKMTEVEREQERAGEFWVWMEVPDEKSLARLLKRYGTGLGKELDWKKLRISLLGERKKN